MNKSIKNIKLFSIREADVEPILLEWKWVKNYFGLSYLLLKTFGALLALIFVLANHDEISGELVHKVGLSVIIWLLLNYGFGFLLRYLTERSVAGVTVIPLEPEPDRLPHYLTLKRKIQNRHKEEVWLNPENGKVCSDYHSVELDLPASIDKKTIAWAEAKGFTFSEAAAALLTAGLADDELETIAVHAGWAEETQPAGDPSWT